MPVNNFQVRDIFNKLADLLEIEEANPFRVRAYRNAARTVAGLPRNVADMVREHEDLTKLTGIGEDLAAKIKEIVETGTLAKLSELERGSTGHLNELLKLDALGPKRVKILHRELGVSNLQELKAAAEKGAIRRIAGFGRKTEQHILESLRAGEGRKKRILLLEAEQQAGPLIDHLKKTKGIKEITIAGSFRRRQETVGDLDVLVTCSRGSKVMERFVAYEDIEKVVSRGKSRSTIVLQSGLQVDLCVLPEESYGAALHYFTGSQSHNIAIRKIALGKGYKISEYGVFLGNKKIAGKTEQEVYAALDLPFIEPPLREDRGEIEAARQNSLPKLISRQDLRGDLHCHTKETDGRNSLEEMARAAKALGYEYLAITEHSQRVAVARGMDSRRLARQLKEIDRLNERLEGITLLKGVEVDILPDGALDLPDDILQQLDLTVCSVHYNRNLSKKRQTERIIRAMDHPSFNILAHPTGRRLNEREPHEVDLEKIMQAAGQRGCFLEINAQPDRLDLPDQYCKMAKEMKVMLAISTDAHSSSDLELIRFGVDQARRGWLEADEVLNTRSLQELRKMLQR